MKKLALVVLVLFLFAGNSQAQKFNNYKLSAVHFAHGLNIDSYGKQMSMDWIKARSKSEEPFQYDLSGLREDPWSATAGYNLNAQFILSNPENSRLPELRLGAGATVWKEAVVDYSSGSNNRLSSSEVMYCFVENELNVSAELIWRTSGNRFTAYGGLGSNMSASISNTLFLFEYYQYSGMPGNSTFTPFDEESGMKEWKGKNVMYARAYVPLGASIKLFSHAELTVEQRLGFGAAGVLDGSQANVLFNASTNFGIRYNFAGNWPI